jgi:hypothetical protein
MVDHGIREHAVWSASATARNVHCPGALKLSILAPHQKSSIYADTGTAGHQIAERCIRDGGEAIDYLGKIEKTKDHDILVDEDLCISTQRYIDYVRSRKDRPNVRLWLEERFSLEALDPPFEAGGTGDAVLYDSDAKNLEIVDFKNGRGVVDAEGNPQLRTYALGALLAHQDLDVDTVTVTVVQPRAAHKDGSIRSETFHVADLIAWTADLMKSMAKAKAAADAYDAAKSNSVLMDEWTDNWLNPGKCVFCPAEGTCPALRKKALAVAGMWFEPDTGEAKIGNLPTEMSPEKLGETLDLLPMLEDFVKAVRAYAHAQAENGLKIPTPDGEEYHLVDKVGFRKWKDDEPVTAVSLLSLAREHDIAITEDDIFDRKLKSPASIDKTFGTKKKALVEDLWEKPITGSNLVRSDKTTRPAAKSKVETFFEQQN